MFVKALLVVLIRFLLFGLFYLRLTKRNTRNCAPNLVKIMDQSITESDISLSPSQILERLQLLRQLQLLQRGKLQKQRLDYKDSPEYSSKLSDIVSQFTTSSSYETFRSSLQSTGEMRSEESSHTENGVTNISQKVKEQDLVDGVAILNLSQESDFMVTSPRSSRSKASTSYKAEKVNDMPHHDESRVSSKDSTKKFIELENMPILTPKKDFESLVIEKLRNEKKTTNPVNMNIQKSLPERSKKPFLKRGDGTARFGLGKNDIVIQSTKSLPWKRKGAVTKPYNSTENTYKSKESPKVKNKSEQKVLVEISVPQQKKKLNFELCESKQDKTKPNIVTIESKQNPKKLDHSIDSKNCEIHGEAKPLLQKLEVPSFKKNQITKHPLFVNKGKTWAAILTNEQGDFLRKLKQTDYYKNYCSPTKSVTADISCDENLIKLRQEREAIEQNMFNLLENKVSHESFSLENSFFNRFLRNNQMECSGESTPLVLQKCLSKNPKLLHIKGSPKRRHCLETHSDAETNDSEYTDCDHETCSTISECCSCKTVEEISQSCCMKDENSKCNSTGHRDKSKHVKIKEVKQPCEKDRRHDEIVTENDSMKENMAEMNAKLVATSELLKDRLKELEDEIETFRKENNNLAKLREEVDQERQKFYEEKASFEQKFNEEKILSEYYISEEKEKLEKQKLMYERYVREMRGRLNKKDKDEVVNLKKEISDLKDEIRLKDAKSTTIIARLRNQLKISEKDKVILQEEIEKLKKEKRRLHHSNEMTRRMTNIKYLQEINKKLNADTQDILPDIQLDCDVKYKGFEIERQSRSRHRAALQSAKPGIRTRAKSVPNMNVTSRYAKYFSQRDAISQLNENKTGHVDRFGAGGDSDGDGDNDDENLDLNHSGSVDDKDGDYDNEVENNLEKLYNERFKSTSPRSSKSSLSTSNSATNLSKRNCRQDDPNNAYFLRKSTSSGPSERNSVFPKTTSPYISNSNDTRSPVSVINERLSNMDRDRSSDYHSNQTPSHLSTRPKSPVSTLSSRPTVSQHSLTNPRDMTRVIDPGSSKSNLSRTSLNPTETIRPDGTRELRFPNGNVKYIAPAGDYTKFVYYNGDVKENFHKDGTIKYFYAETKTYHTTHPDGLEVLEFPDGQVEKRYKDGSTEVRLPNGSVRYSDPKSAHVREEWRFPDGTAMTVSARGERRVTFANGQVEVHASDHKRREFPDGTVKLVYNDGTSETRYSSGRVRIKDKHGNLIMDSAPG